MNPAQWLQAYTTAVRVAGGDTSVMANYLLVMLMPPAMSWFTSLAPDSIGLWEELKKVFTDNYMATCTRPSTKHDLSRINQKPSELLRSYIQCFSEMRNSIPNITEAEVITAFIRGLHHRELRSKFNRKPPTGIGEMITTANQYADAEEAKVTSTRMQALSDCLTATMIAPTTDVIATAAPTTAATIAIAAVIE